MKFLSLIFHRTRDFPPLSSSTHLLNGVIFFFSLEPQFGQSVRSGKLQERNRQAVEEAALKVFERALTPGEFLTLNQSLWSAYVTHSNRIVCYLTKFVAESDSESDEESERKSFLKSPKSVPNIPRDIRKRERHNHCYLLLLSFTRSVHSCADAKCLRDDVT